MRTFISMFGLALLGLVAAGPTPESQQPEKLHEQMTLEEVKRVFNTEPHAVPEYDVVPIHWPRLHKRAHKSSTKLHVTAFGHNIKLWLNPTDGILVGKNTPVYLAKTDSKHQLGVQLLEVSDAMATVDEILEDREKQASLIVKKTADGRTRISGYIASEGWIVKPLPERLSTKLNRRRRSVIDEHIPIAMSDEHGPVAQSDEHNPIPEYHVIYKTPEVPEAIDYTTMPLEDGMIQNLASGKAPAIIYPQILNMIDHKTYKLFGEYLYDLLEYLVTFWNGVDLRYRGLEGPRVRLNLGAIVVAADATALSFMAQNEVGDSLMNIFGALDALGKYMPTATVYFPNNTYDIAVAHSPLTMCEKKEHTCETGTLGLAYLGGACVLSQLDRTTQKYLGVAVIHDAGAYDGMHSAAHEVGHLFGSDHDGKEGSVCTTEHGNIMAPWPVLNANSNDWSSCSLNAFDNFFNKQNPKCLFNKPPTTSSLPRTLPGRLKTMDQQCEKFEGTKACNTNVANICQRLRCVSKSDARMCVQVGDAPADGSICGDGKICLHGQCLAEKDFD